MSAQRHRPPTPWRDSPAQPGPVVIFDIDGVLATMREFEYLIEGQYSQTRWNRFHRHFPQARVIQRNVNLLVALESAGLQIAFSTTRPEAAAQATWDWLGEHGLPQATMLTRHSVLDGQRLAEDVKLRHWFYWLDHFASSNPVVAWLDDDEDALDALAAHGCPAWGPDRLRRLLSRNKDVPALRILTERTKPSPEKLAENLEANEADWRASAEQWEATQRRAWRNRKMRERMARSLPSRRGKRDNHSG